MDVLLVALDGTEFRHYAEDDDVLYLDTLPSFPTPVATQGARDIKQPNTFDARGRKAGSGRRFKKTETRSSGLAVYKEFP